MSRGQSVSSDCVSDPQCVIASSPLSACFRLKNLIPVKFSFHTSSGPSQSIDSTPPQGGEPKVKKEEQQDPICPSCKKDLSNNVLMFGTHPSICFVSPWLTVFLRSVMKPCAHVTCKTCTDSLVRPAKQCVVCDVKLGDRDIIEVKREGEKISNILLCASDGPHSFAITL